MGGAKKRSLAQAEKQQQLQTTKQQKDQKTTGKMSKDAQEKASRVAAQDISEKELSELAKIKALTSYAVASKYNIRQSVAKSLLATLEKKKTVQQVASGGGFKVYKFVKNE
jgi:ribosomal protein S25